MDKMMMNRPQEEIPSWIHVQDEKSFSRLLYPNPVCFLCMCSHDDPSPVVRSGGNNTNVMVVSWLTATNNRGKFIMSINKRRHTAQILMKQTSKEKSSMPSSSSPLSSSSYPSFTLSVPIAGMEDLVLAVGGISGRLGCKVEREHHNSNTSNCSNAVLLPPDIQMGSTATTSTTTTTTSKRQQKKQRLDEFALNGIPGLRTVPFGNEETNNASNKDIFCVEGTIAHIYCKIDEVFDGGGAIVDDEHYLVAATIVDAYVRNDYFDTTKNLFCPCEGADPFLTFLGSQTFGYVSAQPYVTTTADQR
jgi:flavin reductase (DIM6/NTAB) family NADH-FMN oxidoreductase RutF